MISTMCGEDICNRDGRTVENNVYTTLKLRNDNAIVIITFLCLLTRKTR